MRQLTSGSTGVPKAVEISHANLAANTVAISAGLDIDVDRTLWPAGCRSHTTWA